MTSMESSVSSINSGTEVVVKRAFSSAAKKISEILQLPTKIALSSRGVNGADFVDVIVERCKVASVVFHVPKDAKVEEIIDLVVRSYRMAEKTSEEVLKNASRLIGSYNTEFVRKHVRRKIVNADRNSSYIAEMASRKFLDLAKIYTCVIYDDDGKTYGIPITKERAKLLGMKTSELERYSKINERSIDFKVFDLPPVGEDEKSALIYFGTHTSMGSVVLLHTELFKKVAQRFDSDLIIMPSSVNEVLATPCLYTAQQLEGVRDTVSAANKFVVSKEEYLSDTIYVYKRKTGRISIADPEDFV